MSFQNVTNCCSIHMGLFIPYFHIVLHVHMVNNVPNSELNISIKPISLISVSLPCSLHYCFFNLSKISAICSSSPADHGLNQIFQWVSINLVSSRSHLKTQKQLLCFIQPFLSLSLPNYAGNLQVHHCLHVAKERYSWRSLSSTFSLKLRVKSEKQRMLSNSFHAALLQVKFKPFWF